MARIAVAGFQHETNVFAPLKANLSDFVERSAWPGLCQGEAMLHEVRGINLPVTGAIAKLQTLGHEILPLLWCSATPSAHVCEEAFEHISTLLLDHIDRVAPLDGVLLELHGAMVCEHLSDGDGELLRRIRKHVGDGVPIAVSLDLHANISDQMIAQSSILEAYRTYPHIDMATTGERAAVQLNTLLSQQLSRFPAMAVRRPDFLIPPHWGSTLMEPANSIYEHLTQLSMGSLSGISLACGFPYSDVAEAGPCILAYGHDQSIADKAVDTILTDIMANEDGFNGQLYAVDEAIMAAVKLAARASAPIILADTQDNPGGGGTGDTTGILRALVKHGVKDALVGVLIDADVAAQALRAGRGTVINAALGEKSGLPGHQSYAADFRVLEVANRRFKASGPMLAGAEIDLGPTALLETSGVRIVVGSKAMQTLDQAMFSHLGIDPEKQKIIALKSSVHFRNDFQDMAANILLVASPGPVVADLRSLPFKNLRPGLRV